MQEEGKEPLEANKSKKLGNYVLGRWPTIM